MVNENKGLVYEPKKVYDRKLLRSVIKNSLEKRNRYGANKRLSESFHKIRVTN